MDPDFFGKKQKKWGKKKGLPKYVKKGSKSQKRVKMENAVTGCNVFIDRSNVYSIEENPNFKNYRKVGRYDWKEKDRRRKELNTDTKFSIDKRNVWKDFNKEELVEMSSKSSSDDPIDGKERIIRRERTSVVRGYKGHIEWFEENDKDYALYLKHEKKMTKLPRRVRKRLEDKLRTIEYCKNELFEIENAKYLVDTDDVFDRKKLNRKFDKNISCHHIGSRSDNIGLDRKRMLTCPKSKKRRDIDNHVKSYFSKDRKMIKSKSSGTYF